MPTVTHSAAVVPVDDPAEDVTVGNKDNLALGAAPEPQAHLLCALGRVVNVKDASVGRVVWRQGRKVESGLEEHAAVGRSECLGRVQRCVAWEAGMLAPAS